MKMVSQLVGFDLGLTTPCDVPALRYASHPGTARLHAGFGESQLRNAIRTSNGITPRRPLSLHVQVPFCGSPGFHCGCGGVLTPGAGEADQYLYHLQREIDATAPLFDAARMVRQLRLGGAPDVLGIARLDALMRALMARFRFAKDGDGVEAAIEVDPRSADFDYVCELGTLGFNHISINVQDFDPAVLAAVGRAQQMAQVFEVMEAAHAVGFRSINIDLVCGLPKQTPTSFGQTLDLVADLAPDRVAVHGYARLRDPDADRPDAGARTALFELALEKLRGRGYVHVGMDHFARPDDELVRAQRQGTLQRTFQGYSSRGDCDIVGLGMGAPGCIGDCCSQNARDLPGYYTALDDGRLPVAQGFVLDDDDRIRRAAVNELMCHGKLDMQAFGARHGIRFGNYFPAELERLRRLERDGLVDIDGYMLRATARGRLLLGVVVTAFDAYRKDEARTSRLRPVRSL